MTQKKTHACALCRGEISLRRAALFALPFAALLLCAVLWHLRGTLTSGDDPIFATALGWLSLPEWLAQRWSTWTSRLLLEIPLVLVARSPAAFALWTGISCAALLCVAACLTCVSRRPTPLHAAMACVFAGLLWLTAPMDSGYLTMSAVYLWPLAALCLALLPLRSEKRPAQWVFAGGLLCCVYAADNEQFCVLLLLVLGVAACLRWLRHDESRAGAVYPTVAAALCAGMLAVHLLCPGNAARKTANYSWFADFDMLTLPQKLEMGLSGTVSGMFLTPALSWGVCFLLLAAAALFCLRGPFARLLCCVPAAAWLVLGVLPPLLPQPLGNLLTLSARMTQHGSITLENHANPFSYLLPAVLLGLICCLLAALYVFFGHTPRAAQALGLVLAGCAARMTLIFSPSVWVSGSRTHMILNLCLFAVCLWMLDEMLECAARRPRKPRLPRGTGKAAGKEPPA